MLITADRGRRGAGKADRGGCRGLEVWGGRHTTVHSSVVGEANCSTDLDQLSVIVTSVSLSVRGGGVRWGGEVRVLLAKQSKP